MKQKGDPILLMIKNEVVKKLHFLVGRPIEGSTQRWYGYFNIDWWWY